MRYCADVYAHRSLARWLATIEDGRAGTEQEAVTRGGGSGAAVVLARAQP